MNKGSGTLVNIGLKHTQEISKSQRHPFSSWLEAIAACFFLHERANMLQVRKCFFLNLHACSNGIQERSETLRDSGQRAERRGNMPYHGVDPPGATDNSPRRTSEDQYLKRGPNPFEHS